MKYEGGSATSGYYVSDLIHLDNITGTKEISYSPASVVFGCSTSKSGPVNKSDRAVDGMFGFGQQGFSVVSQLSSQGVIPNSFSHCLWSR